jgi:hypothetical protein
MDKLTIRCADCKAIWDMERDGLVDVLRHNGLFSTGLLAGLASGIGEFTLIVPECPACRA